MKKRIRSLMAIAVAALGMSGVSAQAPRYVLLEHFTQASCGPCAQQNPGFQNTIIDANPDKVKHIAFHTSWPGTDPMYNYNSTESNNRVSYYNVTGVPDVILLGNKKEVNPGGITQADVDYWFSYGSPIKIIVSEVDNGSDRDVTVEVKTVGTTPGGNWVLRTAIVEDPINYGSPPGSNGETHFPNVFRKMLPSSSGDPVAFATVGNSVTFNYNYTEDGAWNTSNIKVIAWVQNETTKEVLNAGSTNDPLINYTLGHPVSEVGQGTTGSPVTFSLTSGNSGTAAENFIYTLTSDMPNDWSSSFDVNSTNYASTCTLSVNAGATNNIDINVTPGTSPYVGKFTLTVSSADNPSSPQMQSTVYVIANVTDLIVNNSGGVGDGTTTGGAANWGSVFTSGLNFAGNTGFAATDEIITAKLIQASQFSGVNNIYLNIGWTFPSFTDAEVTQLKSFLDAGGNLFVAGQDIGWDTWDIANGGNGTSTTQSFFTNYLCAAFSNDGGSANTQLTTQTADAIWGDLPNTAIISNHGYYASSYFYPDELTPAGIGVSIYTYNSTTKVGGVRATNGTWKTVYIGVGMEMLNSSGSDVIIKRAHDWFYGLMSNEEFDAEMNTPMCYPNPSGDYTIIPMPEATADMELIISDMSGRTVFTSVVAQDLHQYTLNTAGMSSGNYFYTVKTNGKNLLNRKFTIAH